MKKDKGLVDVQFETGEDGVLYIELRPLREPLTVEMCEAAFERLLEVLRSDENSYETNEKKSYN